MFPTLSLVLTYLLVTSVTAQSNCGVPGAVNNLKSEKTTNTTTHLYWEPPASAECLNHYKIKYCAYLNNEQKDCTIKTSSLFLNTTQYDVTGLQPCSSNLIQVYTVGKDGGETNTDILIYTGSGDPPKVEKFNIIYVGATNITVDWKHPSGFKDQCYPGYKICYSAKGENCETCSYTIKDKYSTLPSAPLSPCTEYRFSVATVDGNMAEYSKTSAKTYVSVVTAPQMPNVTVEVHNHTAHATWHAPDALSMTCAASYTVENCRENSHENCETLSSQKIPLNATEATITGLDSCINNQLYFNLTGHNGHSSSVEVVVQDPDSEIPVPSGVRVTVTITQLTLYYFKKQNDCISSYRVCWFTGGEAETCHNTSFNSFSYFKNPNLKTCSNYTLHFTALGSGGRSSKNFTTTFLTGPEKVANLTMQENSTARTVNLSWINPPTNHLCVDYIELTTIRLKDFWYTTVKLAKDATTATLTDLTACSEYRFEVRPVSNNVAYGSMYTTIYTTSCSDAELLS